MNSLAPLSSLQKARNLSLSDGYTGRYASYAVSAFRSGNTEMGEFWLGEARTALRSEALRADVELDRRLRLTSVR